MAPLMSSTDLTKTADESAWYEGSSQVTGYTYIKIGKSGSGAKEHSYLKFNLLSLPADAQITAATLNLTLYEQPNAIWLMVWAVNQTLDLSNLGGEVTENITKAAEHKFQGTEAANTVISVDLNASTLEIQSDNCLYLKLDSNTTSTAVFAKFHDHTVSGKEPTLILTYTTEESSENKTETKITVSCPIEVRAGGSFTISGNLTDFNGTAIASRAVSITFLGNTYGVATDTNGSFSKTITVLKSTTVGAKKITVSFTGDETYSPSEASRYIFVLPASDSDSDNDWWSAILGLIDFDLGFGDIFSSLTLIPSLVLGFLGAMLAGLIKKAWKWILIAFFVFAVAGFAVIVTLLFLM